jgi:CRISPR-associated protein Csy1
MQNHHPQRSAELRAVIVEFLNKRLADKLDGIKGDNPEDEPLRQQRRTELHQQFQPATWLEDAARRASQIQAVTHSLKPVHPDAKGTSLYCLPAELASLPVVGSHCLGADFAGDVVGNAAALDVYKFLKLEHSSQSLLALCLQNDADFAAALSDDAATAQAWMDAFASLTAPRGQLASHTLAKQLYWPVTDNPHRDDGFHVLSPLYASSLAHKVYGQLQDDRFSDEAKAAREAKRADTFSERPVREYRHMAVQQLGGTKPQNISQLNSERRGNNHLLASLPPVWQSVAVKPVLNTDSLFHRYSRRPLVRQHVKALLDFLKTDPHPNQATRNQRAGYVDSLLDEFFQFTAELRELEPGWSQHADCDLSMAQAHWLDPLGAAPSAPLDRVETISRDFAGWLNAQLHAALPVGDPEFVAWRKRMTDEIDAFERESSHAD